MSFPEPRSMPFIVEIDEGQVVVHIDGLTFWLTPDSAETVAEGIMTGAKLARGEDPDPTEYDLYELEDLERMLEDNDDD